MFNIFDHSKKIASFKKKLLFIKLVDKENIDMFLILSEFLEEDDSVNVDIQKTISSHLNQLFIALNSYFPKDIRDDFK